MMEGKDAVIFFFFLFMQLFFQGHNLWLWLQEKQSLFFGLLFLFYIL